MIALMVGVAALVAILLAGQRDEPESQQASVHSLNATSSKPIPISPTAERQLLVTTSGLACSTPSVAHDLYEYGHDVSEQETEGFHTLEDAVLYWWENRPDMFRNAEDPLIRSPAEGSRVAFRDKDGNAQVLLYGEQASNGVWNVASAEYCVAVPLPRYR